MSELYSVTQFFPDESYEKFLEFVPAERAVKGFRDLTSSVGAKLGATKRVIVTDGGDCICLEWTHGKGITFPEELAENGEEK
jgi:hypothetical protein